MPGSLSLNAFLILAKTAKRIAVFREIMADRLTPIGIVENLSLEMQDGAVLESGVQHHHAGRYSYITFGSLAQLIAKNHVCYLKKSNGPIIEDHTSHPFVLLRQLISELSIAGDPAIIQFMGAIGFLSYDAVRLFENIPDRHAASSTLPELQFNFYDTTLLFDHFQHKLFIITTALVDPDRPAESYYAAQDKIDQIIKKIMAPPAASPPALSSSNQTAETDLTTDLNDAEFIKLVEQAKAHVQAGDAFQIVLSRCFQKKYSARPFDIYRALRRVSPSPYMFYLPLNDEHIIGASPEKLISVVNGHVTINPIAGTLKRTGALDDQEIARSLLNNEKEKAEHMMLVDLARNDLGAVCKPGSIKINELLTVKHFSHVSHITSTVSGQLHGGKDALDALGAAFPAGTLSGAPKIRAMEVIDALEPSKRNLYGGAICRLDLLGNLDSCIAIRMAHLKNNIATVRAGAGIVFDSVPMAEADETRQKARAMLEAIALAEAGLL